MVDTAVLRQRLEQAERAYHELQIGGGVREFVDQNGERVSYTVANSARLASYIERLKVQLGDIAPTPPARPFW